MPIMLDRHFPVVILATEKKNQFQRGSVIGARERFQRYTSKKRDQIPVYRISGILYVVPCFKNYNTKTNI